MTQLQVIAFLLQRGATEVVPSASEKYRQFRGPLGTHYWVCRHGAVRAGKTMSDSILITDVIWRAIEQGAA